MSEKSIAVQWREKGNTYYVSSSETGLPALIQQDRLKQALQCYEKSKQYSCYVDEICSATKNIAVVSNKLACTIENIKVNAAKRHYYFKDAIKNFDLAFKLGEHKMIEWQGHLAMVFQDCIQEAIYDVGLLTLEKQTNQLLDYVMCISNATNQRGELLIEITQMRFRHALACIQNNDYKQCLHQLAECYWPLEEAKRTAKDELNYVANEAKVMETDIFVHRCIAESTQARIQGDKHLEKLLKEEENLNMEMVWRVVDLYKEAILLTRENDMELEAIALSRLGNVNDKILKDKVKAKLCFTRAIQLAMSLHPKTFDSDDWFKLCYDVLERYQKEVLQQESEIWNKERAVYLQQLEDELKELRKFDSRLTLGELLRHIYITHPPKNKKWKLGEIPEKNSSTWHQDFKQLLRSAVIHYHPDRSKEEDGKKWKVLCEEISKILTKHYETFK